MQQSVPIPSLEELKQHPEIHDVWVSEDLKIVSFHAEEGFFKRDFSNPDAFHIALQAYQLWRFRFQ